MKRRLLAVVATAAAVAPLAIAAPASATGATHTVTLAGRDATTQAACKCVSIAEIRNNKIIGSATFYANGDKLVVSSSGYRGWSTYARVEHLVRGEWTKWWGGSAGPGDVRNYPKNVAEGELVRVTMWMFKGSTRKTSKGTTGTRRT
ncbi:hypothetical protein SMC26_31665 [Actinomadura fulvescens]|uniref:Secreted protein n=1 Tax=Actinomadura fulvescens TaxID=46160 RepID=A0ABP6CIR3_9ACTN